MKTKTRYNIATVLLGVCAMAFVASGAAIYTANAESTAPDAPAIIMQGGASIKNFAPTGIRFVTELSVSDYETLTAKGAEFYTLIIPETLVPEGGITAENYQTINAVRIKAENSIVVGTDTVTFSGTLVGEQAADGTYAEYFPEAAYNIPLTAVSYYTYTENEAETVVFANNPQTYSIAYIASALQAEGYTDPYYTKITDSVLSGGISFGADSYELYEGDPLNTTLNAEGLKATYKTDAESVATVDVNGVVTGVSAGTANITATIGTKSATVTVTVNVPKELGAYDLSLENETSSVTLSEAIEGSVEKVKAGANVITTGVSFADGQLTFTKAALQSLLGEKAYAEGLAIEIYTSADKKYTATVNIATMFIDSAEDLTAITNANTAANIDAYYIVTADIDASTAGITVSGKAGTQTWTADNIVRFVSGDYSMSEGGFAGIFDGRGHVISNLNTFAYKYQGTGGLFGQLLTGSQVKNVAFTDVVINGRFGAMLVGESCGFNGLLENVVITVKAENITPYTGQAKDYTKILWKLSGGEIKNCLFVGVEQIAFDTEVTTVTNAMSVTTSENEAVKSNGGFNASGTKYSAQPNYASVNAMLSALATDNKLQNWGDITYNAEENAIYFGGTAVVVQSTAE